MFAVVASRVSVGSAATDSCKSKPAADGVAVAEMALIKLLRMDDILIITLYESIVDVNPFVL